ncbi:3'-5' exonuclease family protein [Noviherbaspirillum autotrophicum]|uniref:DNA-directed DNA polymerase n=1 Tax=Noviherbaspirillum autotrophicum TaxID=709839 RepID=A0A0C2BPT0_9BURK|nr:3'-5' exonuclease family protein [Noviherbaspirillum autotrophicum]KIF82089.1 hypothetical protein TSA66_16835 [Noviherbaspirillum autotrophicum]
MLNRYPKLIFIDLETTGPNPAADFITEIGMVEVSAAGVSRWSALVNPQAPIPPFIQHLTGINDAMVRDAPSFAMLATEVQRRLQDGLFIAHNARFDYGFLRNAFKRLGMTLRCEALCTVKLSRKLFPHEIKHSLDALVARHGLSAQARHRALADADLLWQFWRKMEATLAPEALDDAVGQLLQRPSIPAQLEPELLDDLPDSPGVYVFYGENDVPLYVGRGQHLRQRVLTHFPDHPSHRDAQLARAVRRLEWHETAGEIGAQLLEAQLQRRLRPAHGVPPERDVCSWQLQAAPDGGSRPVLVYASGVDFGRSERLYGLFNSRSKAEMALQSLVDQHALCPALAGLEARDDSGQACSAHASGRCRGACIGNEAPQQHQARLEQALAALKLKPWPYVGPIGMLETGPDGRSDVHVVDNWSYLGTVRDERDLWDILEQAPALSAFDVDTYKTVTRALLLGKLQVHPLSARKIAAPIRLAQLRK